MLLSPPTPAAPAGADKLLITIAQTEERDDAILVVDGRACRHCLGDLSGLPRENKAGSCGGVNSSREVFRAAPPDVKQPINLSLQKSDKKCCWEHHALFMS